MKLRTVIELESMSPEGCFFVRGRGGGISEEKCMNLFTITELDGKGLCNCLTC